jgi:plastocyanin
MPALLGLAAMTLFLGACGGDDESDAATTPAASVTAEAGPRLPDGDGAITVVARDLAFDVEMLQAPTGVVTIRLDNQDSGTPHNVHFFAGQDARGESAGETPIDSGRSTATVEMDLVAGSYFFQCDVHPNMHGILTVR